MIDIAFTIGFIIMAIRIIKSIHDEADIFLEFNQSKSIALTVLLFPLGPLLLVTLSPKLGWLPAIIVTAFCYLPAWISSRRAIYAFERSGTSRTNKALSAVNKVFGGVLLGMIYIAITLVFIFISVGLSNGITT